MLEASGEGVHIYPNIHDRLLASQAYEEYTTWAVRALTGVSRTSDDATRLEEWIAKVRGTEFEAEAPLHALFTADAGDLDSMHCAEMTTATLQHMGLLSRRLVSEWTLNFDVTRSPRRRRRGQQFRSTQARRRHCPPLRLCGRTPRQRPPERWAAWPA